MLLIDQWSDQSALDEHHHSETMEKIMKLRDKYDLHMKVERFVSDEIGNTTDQEYIRK